MVSIVVFHGESKTYFEIWMKTPFSGPFNTNVEEVPSLFIPDENMKCHFSPPDSIQSHGDVDNKDSKDSNGDNDDFQVTRSQEVMEGGEKKESQKPRCHSQQGIHRWNMWW